MHIKIVIICFLICIFALFGQLNSIAFCGTDHKKIEQYYENCISREISKCESKLTLLAASKSQHLKNYAAVEAQKADYLKSEKDALIKEMLEMQLEPKHYKVEVFLNSRFHEQNQ